MDNPSGCAVLIEIARAWGALPEPAEAVGHFCGGDGGGERAARGRYAARPVIPVGKTALNLNFDSFFPFGRVKDVVVNGAEETSVFPVVQQVAKRFNLSIKADPRPEQGHSLRPLRVCARWGAGVFDQYG